MDIRDWKYANRLVFEEKGMQNGDTDEVVNFMIELTRL
jgi:hypothetical protein